MTHDPTPPLSPTTSIESTDSLVTPNNSDTSTFVDNCAVSEGVIDGHLALFKNSSEVWEEFESAGCDPFGVAVADAGIPISPSSSLLSGIDLLGETTPPPLPEVTAAPVRSGSHQIAVPRRASVFDFPSPPVFVPNRRMTLAVPRSISGSPPMEVSLVSRPCLGASHECIPQPIRHSQSSVLQRWSTLPPAAFHPDKRRGSNELVINKAPGTLRTRAAEHAVTRANPPMVPSLPTVVTPSSRPGPAGYDVHSPIRRSRRPEASDTFTSFMDMSATESALSKSGVHKLFSKIYGSLKSRNKRH